jgi:hypothetical protein
MLLAGASVRASSSAADNIARECIWDQLELRCG